MNNKWIKVQEISDKISAILLQRQEAHNALNLELIEELRSALEDLEGSSCQVVIIEAEGKTFCSGMDLKQVSDDTLVEKLGQQLAALFQLLHDTRIVTIASVQGDAMGGGGGLVASCDFVVLAEGAKIGFPETRRGLVPAQVAVILMQQLGGRSVKELLLRGESVGGQRAVEMGLANCVVKKDELAKTSLQFAYDVIKGGPQAIKATKDLLRRLEQESGSFSDRLQMALSVYYAARGSSEGKEGITSFLEKRMPDW